MLLLVVIILAASMASGWQDGSMFYTVDDVFETLKNSRSEVIDHHVVKYCKTDYSEYCPVAQLVEHYTCYPVRGFESCYGHA